MCESWGGVQITQGIQFPVLCLHKDEELLNSFKRELPFLDKNPDGVAAHDGLGHGTKRVWGDRG